jgi:hypothetical protein
VSVDPILINSVVLAFGTQRHPLGPCRSLPAYSIATATLEHKSLGPSYCSSPTITSSFKHYDPAGHRFRHAEGAVWKRKLLFHSPRIQNGNDLHPINRIGEGTPYGFFPEAECDTRLHRPTDVSEKETPYGFFPKAETHLHESNRPGGAGTRKEERKSSQGYPMLEGHEGRGLETADFADGAGLVAERG